MTKPLLLLALAVLVPTLSVAQISSADAARSSEIQRKVAELDSLVQLVPLALTKDQINALLGSIEKVRQKQREVEASEAKDLVGIDSLVSKSVGAGIDKNVYPAREVQNQIASLWRAMGIRRNLFNKEMVDNVFIVCKTALNEGQLKTMEKSLKPEALEPSLRGVDMDSDARIKFFVRKILLDPVAYDVLVKMSKRKEVPADQPPATSPSI